MSGVSKDMAVAASKAELPELWRQTTDDYVVGLEVSRDGSRCVAGLGNGQVVAFELESGTELFRRQAHDGGVLGLSLAPDGSGFVTCGQEVNAKIWNGVGELVCELPGGGAPWVEHVAWAPKGNRIATAAGKTVRVWSSQGQALVESEPLFSSATGLAWRSDGTGLAAICYGGVHIMPFVAGAKVRHLAWKGSLISIAWSPDSNVVACGTQDAAVHFWRLKTGQDSEMSGYPFKPKALAWDRESKLLATAGDKNVSVWDFRGKGPEGTRPIQLAGHQGVCTRLAFSPLKSVLAGGSQDTSVLLWEPRRSTKPQRFAFLEDEVTGLAWHPQHHTLVGADASGNVSAWRVD